MRKQVNIRLDSRLYQALEALARRDRRSVSQAAALLLEAGLRRETLGAEEPEDLPGELLSGLVAEGGSFDWLEDEPELYDDGCGEPL